MKPLRFASAFRRDLKRISRRGYRLSELELIIDSLRADQALSTAARPHPLKGVWRGHWECHVAPDWLLIYRVTDEQVFLARTGTHADLFKL